MTVLVGPAEGAATASGTDGAGVVSSWADLEAAVSAERIEPPRVVFAAGGAGLDTLGAVLSPFDALLRAGFGWLVEHVGFLREPLDALAGEPSEIHAQAARWDGVSAELRSVAAGYRAVREVPGWVGAAADGHRHAVEELVSALDTQAEQAGALSRLILTTAAAVGTARALIRDAVADFAAALLQYLLAASALALLSGGGSLATVLLTVVVRALEVARWIGERIRRLLQLLDEAGGAAGRIAAAMREAAEGIGAAGPSLRAQAEELHRAAGRAHAVELVEAGKQLSDPGPGRSAEDR